MHGHTSFHNARKLWKAENVDDHGGVCARVIGNSFIICKFRCSKIALITFSFLDLHVKFRYNSWCILFNGPVAHPVERRIRIAEVRGSRPLRSTNNNLLNNYRPEKIFYIYE